MDMLHDFAFMPKRYHILIVINSLKNLSQTLKFNYCTVKYENQIK